MKTMDLKIVIEFNEKQGRGYQLHVILAHNEDIFDWDALDITRAVEVASELVSVHNENHRTDLAPEDVLVFDRDALQRNSDELMTRRLLNGKAKIF